MTTSYDKIVKEMNVQSEEGGASLGDLARICESQGIAWRAFKGATVEDLKKALQQDRLVVVAPESGGVRHAICLAYRNNTLLAADLVDGLRRVDEDFLQEELSNGLVCILFSRIPFDESRTSNVRNWSWCLAATMAVLGLLWYFRKLSFPKGALR